MEVSEDATTNSSTASSKASTNMLIVYVSAIAGVLEQDTNKSTGNIADTMTRIKTYKTSTNPYHRVAQIMRKNKTNKTETEGLSTTTI